MTALVAVFPLNWLGRRLGKKNTLLVAILLMCAAQLSKIVCYHPGPLVTFPLPIGLTTYFAGPTLTIEGPYLILIPTMLLSAGMLMFFTLGSSMVGDVCDEDELNTGTRSEGTYYSVFWWFIKMGTAFASLVMGALLAYTSFDERQNVLMDALGGNIATVDAAAEAWSMSQSAQVERGGALVAQVEMMVENASKLRSHLEDRLATHPAQAEHTRALLGHLGSVVNLAGEARRFSAAGDSAQLLRVASELVQYGKFLRRQSPATLFRLRLVEIGLPLALSVVSILFVLRYPLTEQRCYEIKELLQRRRGELAAAT